MLEHNNERSYGNLADSVVAFLFCCGHWVGYIPIYSLFFLHLFLLSLPPTSHPHSSQPVISNSQQQSINKLQNGQSTNWGKFRPKSICRAWCNSAMGRAQSCYRPTLASSPIFLYLIWENHRDWASFHQDSGLFFLYCSLFILKWSLKAVVQSTDERESRRGHRRGRDWSLIILYTLILCTHNPPGIEHKQVFYEVSHLQGPKVKSTLLSIYELVGYFRI